MFFTGIYNMGILITFAAAFVNKSIALCNSKTELLERSTPESHLCCKS